MMVVDDDFLKPRRCLREPIREIFDAARLLQTAVDAHLDGRRQEAAELIAATDLPVIREWTESLWGSKRANPEQWRYLRRRKVEDPLPLLAKEQRVNARMPSTMEKRAIVGKFGLNCAFCGIPVISDKIRTAIKKEYPQALSWENKNILQHAAFQCMWLQFDHVVPHARGGDNSIENVVVTCAPCNFGRVDATLDELGLIDPRLTPVIRTEWDGLARFMSGGPDTVYL